MAAKAYVNKNFALITSTDTATSEIEFRRLFSRGPQLLLIEVKTGSFKFRVGEAVNGDADIPTVEAEEKVTLQISNGKRNLHYQAAGTGNTFVVSVI